MPTPRCSPPPRAAVAAATSRGVPGERAQTAAIAALESTYGAALRDATVELPAGLADVAPTVLPTIRTGDEVLVAARVTGDVNGDVIVKGTVAGQPFEQRYPLKLAVSTRGRQRLRAAAVGVARDRSARAQRHGRRSHADRRAVAGLRRDVARDLAARARVAGDVRRVRRRSHAADREVDRRGGARRGRERRQRSVDDGTRAGRRQDAVPTAPAAASAPRPVATDGRSASRDGDRRRGADDGARRRQKRRCAPTTKPMTRRGRRDEVASARRPTATTSATAARGCRRRRTPTWSRCTARGSASRRCRAYDARRAEHHEGDRRLPTTRSRRTPIAASATATLVQALVVRRRARPRDATSRRAGSIATASIRRRSATRPTCSAATASATSRCARSPGLVDLDADRVALHERMVRAYEQVGRLAQACSHRIALAALSAQGRQRPRRRRALPARLGRDARRRARARDARRRRARAPRPRRPRPSRRCPREVAGDLVVDAHWDGERRSRHLDRHARRHARVVDGRPHRRRRHRRDQHASASSSRSSRSSAATTWSRSRRGAPSTATVRGTLDITVLGAKQSLPFELVATRTVVGRVSVWMSSHLEDDDGQRWHWVGRETLAPG